MNYKAYRPRWYLDGLVWTAEMYTAGIRSHD